MKRIMILIASLILSASLLNASFVLTEDGIDHGSFSSPGRLMETEKRIPFGFDISLVSDFDELIFLMDPMSGLEGPVRKAAQFLADQDAAFWQENGELLSNLREIDPALPFPSSNPELLERQMHDYFTGRFLSPVYGDGNRTRAFSSIFSSGVLPESIDKEIGGDLDLSLSFFGGHINRGFSWQAGFRLYLDSPDSILSQMDDSGFVYGNDIGAVLYADIGSAAYIIPDKLSIGLTVSPQLFFRTTFSASSLLSARMDNEILSIFASNTFRTGAGIGLTFGAAYRINDELMIALDLRNLPAIQGALYFRAEDISTLSLHPDKDIFVISPDAAFSVDWKHERWHLSAELNDILSQLIWMQNVDGYHFKPLHILDFSASYMLKDDLTLQLSYSNDAVSLGFRTKGLLAEIITKVDRFALGFRCSYGL